MQPIPGSDVALFVGVQKSLLDQNLATLDFLKAHTENWQTVVAHAQSTSWEAITETCGISKLEIEEAAYAIAQSSKVVFAWAMGMTQQVNGVDNTPPAITCSSSRYAISVRFFVAGIAPY
ncbi:MAG: molybdopterin-dependent oxidoreductase [Leptolyngbya sp. Prado105]|nr:molybdopterin-dependent oxidoreductase [Leptolyngbya sp. Prado105]